MVVSVEWFQPNLYLGNGWKSPFPSIKKWLFRVPGTKSSKSSRKFTGPVRYPVRGAEPDTSTLRLVPTERPRRILSRTSALLPCKNHIQRSVWICIPSSILTSLGKKTSKIYQTKTSFVPWTSQKGSFNLHVSCALGSIPFRRLELHSGWVFFADSKRLRNPTVGFVSAPRL